jgi:D-lyxose ketol-isomerase
MNHQHRERAMKKSAILDAQKRSLKMLDRAGIVLTPRERKRIEVCDYNLRDVETIGTEIVIYVNTERCCAKEIILFPWQTCPEHYHPPVGKYVGKEETFRCRWGEVYLYVPGAAARRPKARVPDKYRQWMTVWHEVVLKPGEQYTLKEGTQHWFQAGPKGAVVSEFSTQSYDKADIFTDPNIRRLSNLN